MMQRGQQRKYTYAVGDKVGRVLGAHHALAQSRDKKLFQSVQQHSIGAGAGNQLDQMHVARRVEEVNSAESMALRFWKRLS